MTDLMLVRHAETVWHAEDRYTGVSDVALTGVGHQQAERLAEWACRARLDAIWTSPLSRCQHTAAPSAKATGLQPIADDRLRELDFGSLEGKTKSEAYAIFPEALNAFLRDPVANHFSDGESPRKAAARIMACLNDIVAAHPESRILIVAHSTLIRLALCSLLGIDLAQYRSKFPKLLNCSITHIVMTEQQAGILSFNVPAEISAPTAKAALP